jgi:hypothetical protein
MDIYVADIHHSTTANGDPRGLYPLARDVPIYKDVKVRVPIPLELKDADVLGSCPVPASQIDPQHREYAIKVSNGIALDVHRIER